MFPGHGAGKGDADRSPRWRDHYDEVAWPKSDDGFTRTGNRQVKRYGTAEPVPDDKGPHIKVL